MPGTNTQKTIIKWPGGKSREFKQFKEIIPQHDRYIEPFFGGGAVFFQLQPRISIINDFADKLMDFYRHIKGEKSRDDFEYHLRGYSKNWSNTEKIFNDINNTVYELFNNYHQESLSKDCLKDAVSEIVTNKSSDWKNELNNEHYQDFDNYLRQLDKNISSKVMRMSKISHKNGLLSDRDAYENIHTSIKSGFYMHARDLMNNNNETYELARPHEIANYYFVREFCYGSMFRFNSKGHFNIPYGGMAYNSKNFDKKIDYILSPEIKYLFKGAEIESCDFESLWEKYEFNKKDFIFLDPPYDTDFSSYADNDFEKNDQIRLRDVLKDTNAKFLLIIKNTDFIKDIYEGNGFNINTFDKQYSYNMKGRNNRDAEHLVIYNYTLGLFKH